MCVLCEYESTTLLSANLSEIGGGEDSSGGLEPLSSDVLISDGAADYSKSLIATDQVMSIYLHAEGGAIQIDYGDLGESRQVKHLKYLQISGIYNLIVWNAGSIYWCEFWIRRYIRRCRYLYLLRNRNFDFNQQSNTGGLAKANGKGGCFYQLTHPSRWWLSWVHSCAWNRSYINEHPFDLMRWCLRWQHWSLVKCLSWANGYGVSPAIVWVMADYLNRIRCLGDIWVNDTPLLNHNLLNSRKILQPWVGLNCPMEASTTSPIFNKVMHLPGLVPGHRQTITATKSSGPIKTDACPNGMLMKIGTIPATNPLALKASLTLIVLHWLQQRLSHRKPQYHYWITRFYRTSKRSLRHGLGRAHWWHTHRHHLWRSTRRWWHHQDWSQVAAKNHQRQNKVIWIHQDGPCPNGMLMKIGTIPATHPFRWLQRFLWRWVVLQMDFNNDSVTGTIPIESEGSITSKILRHGLGRAHWWHTHRHHLWRSTRRWWHHQTGPRSPLKPSTDKTKSSGSIKTDACPNGMLMKIELFQPRHPFRWLQSFFDAEVLHHGLQHDQSPETQYHYWIEGFIELKKDSQPWGGLNYPMEASTTSPMTVNASVMAPTRTGPWSPLKPSTNKTKSSDPSRRTHVRWNVDENWNYSSHTTHSAGSKGFFDAESSFQWLQQRLSHRKPQYHYWIRRFHRTSKDLSGMGWVELPMEPQRHHLWRSTVGDGTYQNWSQVAAETIDGQNKVIWIIKTDACPNGMLMKIGTIPPTTSIPLTPTLLWRWVGLHHGLQQRLSHRKPQYHYWIRRFYWT